MNLHVKAPDKPPRAKVYAITSGKGGVGKTFISVNLSIALSQAGIRVLLIDSDTGLANVDLMMGVSTTHTIEDVIYGNLSIFDALVEGPLGLTILPAASGVGRIEEMAEKGIHFEKELLKLEKAFDMIFIDTGAGISANVVDFIFMAEELIVVMTPEPTAFADAYAVIKIVTLGKPRMQIGVIVNTVQSGKEAETLFGKFNDIVKRFLGKEIMYRGYILQDRTVAEAVMRQIPLALYARKSPSMQSIKRVARDLLGIKITPKTRAFSADRISEIL